MFFVYLCCNEGDESKKRGQAALPSDFFGDSEKIRIFFRGKIVNWLESGSVLNSDPKSDHDRENRDQVFIVFEQKNVSQFFFISDETSLKVNYLRKKLNWRRNRREMRGQTSFVPDSAKEKPEISNCFCSGHQFSGSTRFPDFFATDKKFVCCFFSPMKVSAKTVSLMMTSLRQPMHWRTQARVKVWGEGGRGGEWGRGRERERERERCERLAGEVQARDGSPPHTHMHHHQLLLLVPIFCPIDVTLSLWACVHGCVCPWRRERERGTGKREAERERERVCVCAGMHERMSVECVWMWVTMCECVFVSLCLLVYVRMSMSPLCIGIRGSYLSFPKVLDLFFLQRWATFSVCAFRPRSARQLSEVPSAATANGGANHGQKNRSPKKRLFAPSIRFTARSRPRSKNLHARKGSQKCYNNVSMQLQL